MIPALIAHPAQIALETLQEALTGFAALPGAEFIRFSPAEITQAAGDLVSFEDALGNQITLDNSVGTPLAWDGQVIQSAGNGSYIQFPTEIDPRGKMFSILFATTTSSNLTMFTSLTAADFRLGMSGGLATRAAGPAGEFYDSNGLYTNMQTSNSYHLLQMRVAADGTFSTSLDGRPFITGGTLTITTERARGMNVRIVGGNSTNDGLQGQIAFVDVRDDLTDQADQDLHQGLVYHDPAIRAAIGNPPYPLLETKLYAKIAPSETVPAAPDPAAAIPIGFLGDSRILMSGGSLTGDVTTNESRSFEMGNFFTNYLASIGMPVRVVAPFGQAGSRTDQHGKDDVIAEIIARAPAVLHMITSTNDSSEGVPFGDPNADPATNPQVGAGGGADLGSTIGNLYKIFKAMEAAGILVVFCEIPRQAGGPNTDVQNWVEARIADGTFPGVIAPNVFDALSTTPGNRATAALDPQWSSDGLHPNTAGGWRGASALAATPAYVALWTGGTTLATRPPEIELRADIFNTNAALMEGFTSGLAALYEFPLADNQKPGVAVSLPTVTIGGVAYGVQEIAFTSANDGSNNTSVLMQSSYVPFDDEVAEGETYNLAFGLRISGDDAIVAGIEVQLLLRSTGVDYKLGQWDMFNPNLNPTSYRPEDPFTDLVVTTPPYQLRANLTQNGGGNPISLATVNSGIRFWRLRYRVIFSNSAPGGAAVQFLHPVIRRVPAAA